jgi:hypothetical protein
MLLVQILWVSSNCCVGVANCMQPGTQIGSVQLPVDRWCSSMSADMEQEWETASECDGLEVSHGRVL